MVKSQPSALFMKSPPKGSHNPQENLFDRRTRKGFPQRLFPRNCQLSLQFPKCLDSFLQRQDLRDPDTEILVDNNHFALGEDDIVH